MPIFEDSGWKVLYVNPDGSNTLSGAQAHWEADSFWWNEKTGLIYPYDSGFGPEGTH